LKKVAIIVAGGSGERMGTSIPKQFLKISGKEIVVYTIEKFLQAVSDLLVILVLPKAHFYRWEKIAKKFNLEHVLIAEGGSNRFESVQSGLSLVDSNTIVAIHDAVRPLVNSLTIQKAFDGVKLTGACIPVMKLNESIRELTNKGSNAVIRENFRLVQTPQCFKSELLKEAYSQPYQSIYTDDASVVENHGIKVSLVEGNVENIKITTPIDLALAKHLLKVKK
tara:strand:+ start:676 stop:1344 length:669 start_codon:yes stop_codon:yes gene_type:complete